MTSQLFLYHHGSAIICWSDCCMFVSNVVMNWSWITCEILISFWCRNPEVKDYHCDVQLSFTLCHSYQKVTCHYLKGMSDYFDICWHVWIPYFMMKSVLWKILIPNVSNSNHTNPICNTGYINNLLMACFEVISIFFFFLCVRRPIMDLCNI